MGILIVLGARVFENENPIFAPSACAVQHPPNNGENMVILCLWNNTNVECREDVDVMNYREVGGRNVVSVETDWFVTNVNNKVVSSLEIMTKAIRMGVDMFLEVLAPTLRKFIAILQECR